MCLLPKRRPAAPAYDPRKKALLVGINYIGTDKALKGCIRVCCALVGCVECVLHDTCLRAFTVAHARARIHVPRVHAT